MSIVQIKDKMTMEDLLKNKQEVSLLPGVGELVDGIVVNVSKSQIVVDINSAAVGIIRGDEALDSNNTLKKIQIGETIQATIIAHENSEGYVLLSLRQASQGVTWKKFVDAFNDKKVIPVIVREANKGGLLIEEDGIRGFIPVSQLSPEHYPRVPGGNSARILQKLNQLVGKPLQVRVINMDESEGRMILSERAAQSEERLAVLAKIEEGQILKGKISGVVDFGIFVNYNGVEGLVHISEIDWGHVANPADYAKVGDDVEVLVIGIEGEKISFSVKRLTPDPWIIAAQKYVLGDKVIGKVNKITDYGVFVKLEEAVSGLIHNSELSDDDDNPDPESIVSVGQDIEVTIINIDEKKHELGLSLRTKPRKESETNEDADEAKVSE